MDLVTCVQMVAGRIKLDNHIVTNAIMGNLQGEKEPPAVANVVSKIFGQVQLAFIFFRD